MAEAVPCIKLPEVPEIPRITLFGGASLSGFIDFSAGMPSQCTATFSLLQQLSPMLASLVPILKILKVLQALKGAAESAFLDAGDLLAALADLIPLFASFTPAGMALTISGILKLLIGFLNCFIGQLEAALKVQANIAALQASAGANPAEVSLVLKTSLSCAQANASLALDHALASLGPLQVLIETVTIIGGIAGVQLDLKFDTSGAADMQEVITNMKATITQIEEIVQNLPS